jgi:hypothetical protein
MLSFRPACENQEIDPQTLLSEAMGRQSTHPEHGTR